MIENPVNADRLEPLKQPFPRRRLHHSLCALLSVAGLFAATASDTNGASINLTPTADAFVSSANPANNYGGAGALEVSAAGLPGGEFESLLQFELSTAKASFDSTFGAGQWSVQSVTLQLTATPPNDPIFNASAAGQFAVTWMQNDSWTEGDGVPVSPSATGITFNSLPSYLSTGDQALGAFSFDGATVGTTSDSLTLATGLTSDLAAGSPTSLLLTAADATMSGFFNSRSFKTATSRPILTLDAAAIPGSWNSNGSGNYSDAANWSQAVPNGIGVAAAFAGGTTTAINASALAVTIDGPVTVGDLNFASAATSYTLASDGVAGHGIVLDNGGAGAAVNVTAGSHAIAAALTLADAGGMTFTIVQGSALTLSGSVTVAVANPTVALNGAGLLQITGQPTIAANTKILVNGGTLKINAGGASQIGSGVTATVAPAATLELAGAVSALSSAVNVTNNGNPLSGGGLVISGTNQQFGALDGNGTTQIDAGSDLTANHIIQGALRIGGTADSPALVTIAASDAAGNPLGESSGFALAGSLMPSEPFGIESIASANLSSGAVLDQAALSPLDPIGTGTPSPIPEPSSLLLLAIGGLGIMGATVRRVCYNRIHRRLAPCRSHAARA